MAVHTEIVPSGDPALGIGLEALRLARMRMTSNAGSSYWPMGDGTGILAGQQAGDQGLVLVDQHGNRMPLIDTTEISQKADDAMSKANAAVDGMQSVRDEAVKGVKEAKDAAANADSKAQSAIDGMQSVRDEAVKGVKEAKDAASTAQSTAASAASKADKLATELDGTKAIVERHTTKLGEVETKVSNSVEHADQALSASTQAVQTANSVKTTADRAYNDAQSALTQSSTAVQTAGEVKTTLETNYLSKKDSDAAYASKSELKQTSDGITSTVEKTYATKSALEALRNIADNAVETWTGSQKPTASNAPASTWATDQLRKQHAGDVYYDTSTGYSYRWGSTDGKSYTWSLIKDSDITKAIADAAKAQSTANGAQQGVDRLDADIPVTYSTKSELRQTSESLTAKVTEAQRVGQNALDKATTVEQTANGLKTTVQEQAQTLKGHTTTIGQLTQKADSLTSSLTQTNQRIDSISVGARNLLAKRDMVTGWLAPENGDLIASGGHASGENIGNVTSGWIPVTAGKMMCLTLYDTFNNTANTGRYWFYKADKKAIKGVEWNPRTPGTVIFTVPAGAAWIRVTAINASNATSPRYKLETGSIPTDWTPAPEDTAQSITEAVTRTSKLEQTLDGFKTTVSQTYETKSDSLAKKTALEQSLNGFKSTVSSTYLSKTDASKTYGTKSELTQTNESLTAKINSTATTANNALSKAASVEATANDLKTTVSEQATTLKGHTSTIGQLTQKADSLTSSLTQTNRNVNIALANSAELIRNPECNSTLGNPDGWGGGMTLSASGAPEGAPVPTYGKFSARGTTTSFRVLRRGRTYRFSAWMAHDSTAKKPAALGCFYHESNGNGRWDAAFRVPTSQSGWKQWSGDLTIPKDAREDAIVWLQIDGASNTAEVTGWYCTLLSIRDVTEAKNAQDTADTAISRASTLEQSLNGFKTTVSQNYETKSDSLAKQSALEQSLNSFKSTVSSTYSTKNELDGLSAMASKTWSFWKDASTSPRRDWVRLGTLTSNGDSSSVQIDVLTGNGWNGAPYQNSRLSIMVKDSWQSSPSTSRAFGVSVLRENCQNAQVRVMALAADECEIWCYLPWQYGSGQYTISGSYKAWSNNTASQSDAPTSGTSQDVAYRLNAEQLRSDVESTYATKSSVEQTATSIKSSVSETYATKTTVQNLSTTLTQTKESLTVSIKQAQTSADTANGNAANAQSRVGSLESCIRMTSDGVRVGHIVNGGFQGYSALVSPHGSFDVLDESGRTAATFQASVIDLLNGLVRLRNANNTGELLIKAPDGTYGYLSYNSDGMFLKSPTGTIRLEPKPGCNVYTRSKAIQPSQAGICNKATDANGIISVDNLSPPDGNANNGILSVTVTPINIGQDPTLLAFTPVIWAKGVNGFQVRLKTNNNTWVSGAQPYAFCWHAVWA